MVQNGLLLGWISTSARALTTNVLENISMPHKPSYDHGSTSIMWLALLYFGFQPLILSWMGFNAIWNNTDTKLFQVEADGLIGGSAFVIVQAPNKSELWKFQTDQEAEGYDRLAAAKGKPNDTILRRRTWRSVQWRAWIAIAWMKFLQHVCCLLNELTKQSMMSANWRKLSWCTTSFGLHLMYKYTSNPNPQELGDRT